MITIGVLSDTHIPERSASIPMEILYGFERADCIIHAGDITDGGVIEQLERIAPVYAVCGNMDGGRLRKMLPEKRIVEIGGRRIGVIHGGGSPVNIKKRIYKVFEYDKVDCIVFGHTHCPEKSFFKQKLFFNPGSATDRRFAPQCSFGFLFIDDDRDIESEIIMI